MNRLLVNSISPYHPKRKMMWHHTNLMLQRMIRSTNDLLHEGVAVLNVDGIFIGASQRTGEILIKNRPEKLIGRSLYEFLDFDTVTSVKSLIELARFSQKRAGPVELSFITPEVRTISTSILYRANESSFGDTLYVVLNDITEWAIMKHNLEQVQFDLEQSYSATLEGWAQTLELRDLETKGHADRVTKMAVNLSLEMGFSLTDMEKIRHGALLHDIGKLAIPDSILLKPGKLTEDEWILMRKHPVYAYNLLNSIGYLQSAINIPYNHHEKWDGSGYPRGLRGDKIPMEARIFAVIDVWDAVTNPRPYRSDVWSRSQARDHVYQNSGSHFDPKVVEAFLDAF